MIFIIRTLLALPTWTLTGIYEFGNNGGLVVMAPHKAEGPTGEPSNGTCGLYVGSQFSHIVCQPASAALCALRSIQQLLQLGYNDGFLFAQVLHCSPHASMQIRSAFPPETLHATAKKDQTSQPLLMSVHSLADLVYFSPDNGACWHKVQLPEALTIDNIRWGSPMRTWAAR